LRHYNDLLDYLLEDIGDLDELLLSGANVDWDLFDSIDDLQHFFNVVDIPDHLLEFLGIYQLLDSSFNFQDLSGLTLDGHYLLLLAHHLLHGLDDRWHFDYLLDYLLDILVYPYDLRNYSLNLDQFGYFH
jgi:hypothetical protein